MPLSSYTSPDEIRAVLGVSATELPDSVINLSQWDTLNTLDLEDVNVGLPTTYATVSALPELSRSTSEQRLYALVRLFTTYAIAKNLLTSLPLFSVQQLTDGRAEFQRQRDIFEDVRVGVDGMFNKLRLKVSAAYVILVPADTAYTSSSHEYTAAVGLAINPVTNA